MGAYATLRATIQEWAATQLGRIPQIYGSGGSIWSSSSNLWRKTLQVIGDYMDTMGGGGPHASSHQPGGGDAMTVDAAAATGSLRTIGTSATSACAGNDARLSDARAPTTHDNTKHSAAYVTASDISTHAAVTASVHGSDGSGKFPSTPTLCGLGNVTNAAQALASEKAAANGIATLDANSRLVQAEAWDVTTAATSATTGTMTVNMTTSMITITPTGACTFNASGGATGRQATFLITTSGTTSYTLTWGTNFRKAGTLATGTTSGRRFSVTFLCIDGTTWQELARTAAQT